MPDAIVLCGGAGLRLRSITGDRPKSLAGVGSRPFLDLLLAQLARHGVTRAILAVGHRKEAICEHFADYRGKPDLVYSAESSPLGTGGALRKAVDLLETESALVLNGDSYTDVNLKEFVAEHRESGAEVSLVVVHTDGRSDCGTVQFDQDCRIKSFAEKAAHTSFSYANAGIYMISRRLLQSIPLGRPVSLEHEIFTLWLEQQEHLRAYVHGGTCTDIGTPDRYWKAQEVLAEVGGRSG